MSNVDLSYSLYVNNFSEIYNVSEPLLQYSLKPYKLNHFQIDIKSNIIWVLPVILHHTIVRDRGISDGTAVALSLFVCTQITLRIDTLLERVCVYKAVCHSTDTFTLLPNAKKQTDSLFDLQNTQISRGLRAFTSRGSLAGLGFKLKAFCSVVQCFICCSTPALQRATSSFSFTHHSRA